MIHEKVDIRVTGSCEDAHLLTYFIEDSKDYGKRKRPCVLVIPGGAYEHHAAREGEPVALRFNAMGYNAAVLEYSLAPVHFPVQMMETARAVAFLREHAEKYHIKKNSIVIAGFSAGGHHCEEISLRPDALIAGYPVITSGEYAHEGSFKNLLGDEYEYKKEMLSLENAVSDDAPPAFIWNTFEDGSVPAMNGLLLAKAYLEAGVPVEYHLFEKGGHGLALANEFTESWKLKENVPETAVWIELAEMWLKNKIELS